MIPQGSQEPAQADKRTAAFEDIFGRSSVHAKPCASNAPSAPPPRIHGSISGSIPPSVWPSYTPNPRWNYPQNSTSARPPVSNVSVAQSPAGMAYEPYRVHSQPSLHGLARTQEPSWYSGTNSHGNSRYAPQVPMAHVHPQRYFSSMSGPSQPPPVNVMRQNSTSTPNTDPNFGESPLSINSKMSSLGVQDTPPSIPKSVVLQHGSLMDATLGAGMQLSPAPSADGSQPDSSSSQGMAATSSFNSLASLQAHPDPTTPRPRQDSSVDWQLPKDEEPSRNTLATEAGEDTRATPFSDMTSSSVRTNISNELRVLYGNRHMGECSDPSSHSQEVAAAEPWHTYSSSPTSLLSRKSSHGSLAPMTALSSVTPNQNLCSVPPPRRNKPMHPALLSEVARAFARSITTSELSKDGLTYSNAFDGRQAVDKLAAIIRTSDRNLALLLGRALDAQKMFHDVTYDHRLRDSTNELYQFQSNHGQAGHMFDEGSEEHLNDGQVLSSRSSIRSNSSHRDSANSMLASGLTPLSKQSRDIDEMDMSIPSFRNSLEEIDQKVLHEDDTSFPQTHVSSPTGVFTLLTPCYSPTCARGQPCYSIACPRRLESQSGINSQLQSSVEQYKIQEGSVDITSQLWAESVPKELYETVPPRERKRQEVIFEVIATERAYVHDLEYVRDFWIQPLSTQHIISPVHRAEFVKVLFINLTEILAVNRRVTEILTYRQKQRPVVECIGDIYLNIVDEFDPYVHYGANQMFARLKLESEKATNPFFALFVEDTERKAESRKLELNGYLTKPTTRLARYPLLFEQLLKYTEDGNPDKTLLPVVIQKIKALLTRVNTETGRSENRLQLSQLSSRLIFKPGETVDLRLGDENRELVFKGTLKKRSGTQSDNADIHLYLFDHALLMVKHKIVHKTEMQKVYRKPIPLELLQVTVYEDVPTGKGNATRIKSILSRSTIGQRTSIGASANQPTSKQDAKTGFAITFSSLGKKGYSLTLWASTYISRAKWLEHVEARQEILRNRTQIFDVVPLSPMVEAPYHLINSAVPFDFGRQIVYGTSDGVYISELRPDAPLPTKVLPLMNVTQVDVLEEYQILIVLAEQSVYTFTLDALDASDPVGSLKRGRRISSHTTFFRAGICLGRTLVCVVKSGPVSSTIKTLEPIEQNVRMKKQPTFRKLLQGGQDTLRVFKEFYIPTESSSIHFLKSKLCVGTAKGFEIVDLETLDTQGLLDPADASLDFVQRRENLKPMAIYRIEGEFLLCYNEFAFYVNKNGWRAKGNWIVHWEGNPTSFALHHPYVLAFEPNFIEVRHVESGVLHQVITGHNMHCIFADSIHTSLGSTRSNYAARTLGHKAMIGGRMPMSSFAPPGVYSPVSMEGGLSPSSPSTAVFRPTPGSPVPGSPYSTGYISPTGGSPAPVIPRTATYGVQSPGTGAASQKPLSSVHESVMASRSHIVFVGDSSVYFVRLHNANP